MEKINYQTADSMEKSKVLPLYEDAGWTAYTENSQQLMAAISKSLRVVGAWDAGKLVGLIRVVGDGEIILFIQDILVLQDYKRRGIGTNLMKLVMNEFKGVRQKVLLTEDTEETRGFYEALGFRSCDDGRMVAFAIQR
ncbi:GNAT family N-acetyltransferase [Isachenkonia alkalipeptolytica]|uniref:GNAT family N-acetyltransferase n=1 Tax=Isachenkonia alkalipeptolytica TaxID=2565777 RepID=A0AA44BF40_9CLOT|nr:GNAT family N-acetyltransferase [Isachenkonia alkalipeptolytica]NBG88196.1 GNAT family N-acetyltransferase [Isachenkonia alkalipeptolytica]